MSPTMIRIVVDFPAPLGPRKPVTRPGRAVNVTSSTAVKPAYFLVSDWTVIMSGSLAGARGRAHRGSRWDHPRNRPPSALRVDPESRGRRPAAGGLRV